MTLATLQETTPDGRRSSTSTPAQVDWEAGEPSGEVQAYYLDAIELPGFGHQPERCLPLTPVGFCDRAGHLVLGRSSCGVRYCPEHWRDWLQGGVVEEVARLAAYRHDQDGWGKRLVHAMVSPPQEGRWGADDVFRVRSEEVYDVLESVGVRGGAVYPHAYRGSDRGRVLFETATESGDFDPERGQWAFYRELAGDDWEEMKDYIAPAPHYHALAAVEDFDADGAPEGWVAKNLRALSRFDVDDVESYRDMASVAAYLRTHGVSIAGRNSVTWFGDVHPATFDPEEAVGSETWAKIRELAEEAVMVRRDGTRRDGAIEGAECDHEDCAGAIVPIDELATWMDDEEWWVSIEPEQRNQLRAAMDWWVLQVDRPPPGRQGNEEALREWLTHRGRVIADRPGGPTGAGTATATLRNYGE